jgi:serine/threonine-protein kinase
MKCPSCQKETGSDSRFCPGCGTALPATDTPTLSRPESSGSAAAAAPAPAPAAAHGRFVPGTVLAGRYRIVAQVGRGGMGEVYRADDLRLGQTVALKFLPEFLTGNPAAVERMQREVRLARQVSHPHVCRVFDLGEADHVPFISMEFVDGEDLGSLLQRIGHLPQDKALQVAHQICAGLAEAHAFGVLHRDLKPANVMLDGRGNVRITDFGLAATAGELTGEDARAGTPAYMAPEQLTGQKATTQSDLYALGLVLYELFSGKEAYPAATITEMLAQRQKGAPAKISSVVKGLDPAIERVIFQCLERDPQNRPRSALVVAAALPGGDPLAAAVAAGETPSPEMVAAATDQQLASVGQLWVMLAALMAGLAVVCLLWPQGTVLGLAPLEESPDAMAARARQLVRRLGYVSPPADTAYWYEVDTDYVRYRADHGRTPEVARQWRSAVPTPMRFIYRQSPQTLAVLQSVGRSGVTLTEPPDNITGMSTMVLDAAGRLLSFTAVPGQIERGAAATSLPDWGPLLAEAGLDQTALTPATPDWLPPTGFDSRAAWDGVLGGERVHVVAAYRGAPVYFRVIAPWTRSESAPAPPLPASERIPELVYWFVGAVLVVIAALFLARRNLRLGRGDRKGATRIATAMFIAVFASWVFASRHVGDPVEAMNFVHGTGVSLYFAAYVYLGYLAVEPYIRRRWPKMLVSWTRVLAGRFTDPRVGRDLLAGCLAAVLAVAMVVMARALPAWVNIPGQVPGSPPGESLALRGWAGALAAAAAALGFGFVYALGGVVMLLLARFVMRRLELAIAVFLVVATAMGVSLFNMPLAIAGPLALAVNAIYLLVLFRFGILALVAAQFTAGLFGRCFLTADPARWYFWPSALVLIIVAGMAVHGFRAALAGRPAFGKRVLED